MEFPLLHGVSVPHGYLSSPNPALPGPCIPNRALLSLFPSNTILLRTNPPDSASLTPKSCPTLPLHPKGDPNLRQGRDPWPPN